MDGDNSTVKNSNFENNTADIGAGLIIGGDNGQVLDSNFTNNTADIGGGLVIEGNDAVVNNSQFTNNTAGEGAGLISYGNGTNITNSNFTGNNATRGGGAVIKGDDALIENSSFVNNTADEGAGVIVDGNNAMINNSTFEGNTAVNGSGVILNGDNNTVTNSSFINNTAEIGAGVIVNGNNNSVTNSTFANNTATESGSSIVMGGNSTNTTIEDNKGTNNYEKDKQSSDLITYSSKTVIYVDSSYNLGDSMLLDVSVSSNGKYALDGIVKLNIGSYEEYLSVINSHAIFTVSTVALGEGSFVVYAKYSNDTHNTPSQTSSSFMIMPQRTISADNMQRGYNSTYDFKATFLDFDGNRLSKVYVEFVVDGIQYKVKTNSKGVAYLKAKLKPGTHSILIKNLVTKESLTKSVKIMKRIYAKNKKPYYNSGYYYKVKIYGANGKRVGANKKVTFTFNGKKYTVKTNKYGIAKLKLTTKNVLPKTYKIKVQYLTYKVTKKIKVRHVIRAKKITSVSKNATAAKVRIQLKNTKVLKNKELTVKFMGKTSKLKTNSKGFAYLKISHKTISSAKKGYLYPVKIKYLNDERVVRFEVRSTSNSNFNVYFIL